MQKKKNEREALYGELGKAFNFTKGDLEANRAGFISHRQQEIQNKKTAASVRLHYIFAAYIAVFALVPLILGFVFFPNIGINLFLIIVISLIFIGFFVYLSYSTASRMSKLHDAEMRFKRVSEIICQKSPGHRLLGFNDSENPLIFPLSEEAYKLLPEQRYRVYYLITNRDILSLEVDLPE